MKNALLFIIVVLIGFSVQAQAEFGKKFKPIPPSNMGVKDNKPKESSPSTVTIAPEAPTIKAPNILKDNPSIIKSEALPSFNLQVGKDDKILMNEEKLPNPGGQYIPQMEKDLNKKLYAEGLKEGRGVLVKRNIDFGEIKTKSKFFIIKLSDFGAIDGDMVKVSNNNFVLVPSVLLTASYREIKINLDKGFNKMEFEALNIGTLGGNTAEIRIYDDQGVLVTNDYWDNLAAGFKASILVIKEE